MELTPRTAELLLLLTAPTHSPSPFFDCDDAVIVPSLTDTELLLSLNIP